MGVSENSGTAKSSILRGFSIINHPFAVPLFLDPIIYILPNSCHKEVSLHWGPIAAGGRKPVMVSSSFLPNENLMAREENGSPCHGRQSRVCSTHIILGTSIFTYTISHFPRNMAIFTPNGWVNIPLIRWMVWAMNCFLRLVSHLLLIYS